MGIPAEHHGIRQALRHMDGSRFRWRDKKDRSRRSRYRGRRDESHNAILLAAAAGASKRPELIDRGLDIGREWASGLEYDRGSDRSC